MKRFAVFDIDGTLIRWQLYHAVVDKLAKVGALGNDTHQLIHEARMRWKRRELNYGFKEYEQTLITLYEKAIAKISPTQFDQFVDEIIAEYQDQAYIYTRDLIARLKEQDYLLLAISGSQKELVEKIAKHYGFDDFIASDYERVNGSFSGKVYVASFDKKAALQKLVSTHGLNFEESYAVGDSKSDAAMLEMVAHPIAFNPERELLDIAKSRGWKIVLERKNAIYELENQNGTYTLV